MGIHILVGRALYVEIASFLQIAEDWRLLGVNASIFVDDIFIFFSNFKNKVFVLLFQTALNYSWGWNKQQFIIIDQGKGFAINDLVY